jgi:hypothetical protein
VPDRVRLRTDELTLEFGRKVERYKIFEDTVERALR